MMQSIEQDVDKILYTKEQIEERVQQLGEQITQDYADKNLLLVGILKGGDFFHADLARAIYGKIKLDFMVASSYGNEAVSSGRLKIKKDLEGDLSQSDILLVEDLIDTGLTMKEIKDYLLKRGARSVRICALLNKAQRRVVQVQIDYLGFEVPDEFIIGYGIDYAEYYRNLPYVATLKRSVYEKR